jgi:Secretion system C-terminal sorting domain
MWVYFYTMKKLLIFSVIYLFTFFNFVLGQSKRDQSWVLGLRNQINHPQNKYLGGMILKFDEIGKDPIITTFDSDYAGWFSGTANDTIGNVQFYTTNCDLYNNENQLMENGNGLNSNYYDTIVCKESGGRYDIRSGTLLLPTPDREEIYQILTLNPDTFPSSFWFTFKLLLTQVDVTKNGGLGAVISKNQQMLNDSLHDAISSVRHGNGRDWWIIVPHGTGRAFYSFLLSPTGLEKITDQSFPAEKSTLLPEIIDDFTFEHLELRYEFNAESFGGQAIFSPDGTKYARIYIGNGVEIYDFNRCDGTLNLSHTINFKELITFDTLRGVGACGLAFSPNSHFLYFNDGVGLYQLDLDSKTENWIPDLIDKYDGFEEIGGFPTSFYQMRNAPNGKIYLICSSGMKSLHVINEPNRKGKCCHFVQRGFELPRINDWVINYFPNYNLLDLSDSLCDTLGINGHKINEPEKDFDRITMYPNPATNAFFIFNPLCSRLKVTIWNVSRQLFDNFYLENDKKENEISCKDWYSGVYFVQIIADDQPPIVKKLVVVHK